MLANLAEIDTLDQGELALAALAAKAAIHAARGIERHLQEIIEDGESAAFEMSQALEHLNMEE